MKKAWMLLLTALMALSFCACQRNTEAPAAPAAPAAQVPWATTGGINPITGQPM